MPIVYSFPLRFSLFIFFKVKLIQLKSDFISRFFVWDGFCTVEKWQIEFCSLCLVYFVDIVQKIFPTRSVYIILTSSIYRFFRLVINTENIIILTVWKPSFGIIRKWTVIYETGRSKRAERGRSVGFGKFPSLGTIHFQLALTVQFRTYGLSSLTPSDRSLWLETSIWDWTPQLISEIKLKKNTH